MLLIGVFRKRTLVTVTRCVLKYENLQENSWFRQVISLLQHVFQVSTYVCFVWLHYLTYAGMTYLFIQGVPKK